ncbi:transposase, partial [Escherichia coli]
HFVVNRYVRPQYSCSCCQKVFSGEMPAHILPKSAVEPSVIAQVIINKYGDHLPLYRQQQVFARSVSGCPSVRWLTWLARRVPHYLPWRRYSIAS